MAATHRNLAARAKDGTFRADLYFRLSVVEIHVPALRERKDDIPLLVERFLSVRRPPVTLADLPPNALSLLQAHDWPGNVRELRNTVSRLLLFPEMLPTMGATPGASPTSAPPPPAAAPAPPADDAARALLDLPLPEAREVVMEQFERKYVEERLKRHAGNVSRAAESMGVSRQLLHRLIERYGLRTK